MPVNTELVASLLAPIPGEQPAGKSLRYDPRYDKVKEARREDLDLPPGGLTTDRKVADWPQVVTVATQLLREETKDLQIGAWLTEGLTRREGYGGLATGLAVLTGFLSQYWEQCYPEYDEEDLEVRAGPLEWIGQRFDVSARQVPVAGGGVTFVDYQGSRAVPTEQQTESDPTKRALRDELLGQGRRAPEEVDRAIATTKKPFYKALVADVEAAREALAELEATSDEKFGRDAPAFSGLRGALEEIGRFAASTLAVKLQEDPDPVVEVPGDVSADAVGSYAPPAGWNSEGGGGPLAAEPTSVADATGRVAVAARYLRAQDPTNPAPYLMLRGLRWGELLVAGAPDPRLLDAPPTAARTKLKGLLLDGQWERLLEEGEFVMAAPHGRGWLDLQRYALTACAQLGGGYAAVAGAIRGELRSLLAALPRLPEMTLMDDTPTANDETRAWLESEGLLGSARDGADDEDGDVELGDGAEVLDDALGQDDETNDHGGLAHPASGTRRRRVAPRGSTLPRDPFAGARAELQAGRPNRAVELLVAELARERSPRGRFVRQTQIAWVMVEGNLAVVARPILEKLVAEIDERALENWEAGPLVAQPMALLCRVIDKLEDTYAEEQRKELYLRVCRLDPLQAIALQRGA